MPLPPTRPSLRLTKFQALCARLNDLAQRLGPDAKLPTVLQLRDTMGVSISTLNNALNELEAQNIIYRRHGVGIYVSPRLNERSISLVCDPSFFRGANVSPFWDMLVERARARAAAKHEAFGFHLAMPGSDPDVPLQDGFINDIRGGRVHGVLSVGLAQQAADWIISQQVPMVAFAGYARFTVELDAPHVVRLGVKALAEQGCRRIGLWHPITLTRPLDIAADTAAMYRETLQQSLARQKLPYDPRLVRDNVHLLEARGQLFETHQEQGYRTAYEVFGRQDSPQADGIVITDDMMAHGALVALQNLGVRLGEDLRVATHANRGSDVLIGRADDITLIQVDPTEVVQAMFDTLETLMSGQVPPRQRILVRPKVRKTAA